MACRSTKAEISETRNERSKSYYGGPIGTHQRCFERYHADPVWSSLKFGRKERVYEGIAQILGVPNVITEMDKATNFKFCTHIHRIDRNKSPLKISGKVAVGVLRDSGKFNIVQTGRDQSGSYCGVRTVI